MQIIVVVVDCAYSTAYFSINTLTYYEVLWP